MEPTARVHVLCVDDEPQVLEGISLHLRRRYQVATATSGAVGLKVLKDNPGTAVVLSDMRMPGMDGAAFLSAARQAAPDAVRILLTGQTELSSAIAAVNEGGIFRFLTKPCPTPALLAAFESAAEQHRLITAERVLLEHTLRGCVKTLTDVMALAYPEAFGRASRIRIYAAELARGAGLDAIWRVEIAAMLSQIGCITLPTATAEKLYHGQVLSPEEQGAADQLPLVADRLLGSIPRIEDIRAILAHQARRFDGSGSTGKVVRGEEIPVGARILKIASDFDALEAQGHAPAAALATLVGREGWYDPALLEVFATLRRGEEEVRDLPLSQVAAGMVFVDDVKAPVGALLIPRGYQVTDALLGRIRNFAVKGTVRVIVRRTDSK